MRILEYIILFILQEFTCNNFIFTIINYFEVDKKKTILKNDCAEYLD